MRAVVQRVTEASITINQSKPRGIGFGMVVLLGIEASDEEADINWLVNKIVNLRIFDDPVGVMNLSLKEVKGEAMLVSQFTLHARVKKGNRPSYVDAAPPEVATPLYQKFIAIFNATLGREAVTGEFGAHMEITLTNHGPVTILIDTKNKK